jgi:Tol biopolymer transport system component
VHRAPLGGRLLVLLAALIGFAAACTESAPRATPTPEAGVTVAPTPTNQPTIARPQPSPTPQPPATFLQLALVDLGGGRELRIEGPVAVNSFPKYSADGRWLAYSVSSPGGKTGEVFRVDLAAPGPLRAESLGPGFAALPSPLGDAYAFNQVGADGVVRLTVWRDGVTRALSRSGAAAWSPDGEWLAYTEGYQPGAATMAIVLADAETLQEQEIGRVVPCHCDGNGAPIWSADGKHIYYGRAIGGGERDYSVDSGTTLTVDEIPFPPTQFGEVSPSGTRRWTPVPNLPGVVLLDGNGNQVGDIIPGSFMGWSADGAYLAMEYFSYPQACIAVHRSTDASRVECLGFLPLGGGGGWSPRGAMFAYLTGKAVLQDARSGVPIYLADLHLIDFATGRDRVISADLVGRFEVQTGCMSWSPDAHYVAVTNCG